MSKVSAYCDTIDGNCGVGYLNDIERMYDRPRHAWDYGYGKSTPIENITNPGGCRWLLSGFISNDECKEAYEALCAKHVLVYQSPVRLNANSGRRFFFCIFDTARRRRAT